MPILEFYSPQTNRVYSFLARNAAEREAVPRCPDNPEHEMRRQLSSFSVTGQAQEESGDDWMSGMDESKMEGLLAEMEKSGMDADNPDPKQLGGFMRKLRDVMGGNLPSQLNEMISRLEKGEDPDSIERDMGSELDDADFTLGEVRKLFRAGPSRDPKLYEMRDYA